MVCFACLPRRKSQSSPSGGPSHGVWLGRKKDWPELGKFHTVRPNMRRFLLTCLCLGLVLGGKSAARADTIELTNGEILEGQILRETPTTVTIQVPFSETIMEDRIVPRDEIVRMDKTSPDEAAFQELKEVTIPETAFEASALAPALGALRVFVARFPDSPHLAKVQNKLTQVEAEYQALLAGQAKIQGQLLSAQETAERRQEVTGYRTLRDLQDLANRGDFAGAINRFLAWEKNNQTNPVLPEAVEQARTHLRSFMALLDHEIRNNPIVQDRWERQVALSPPTQQASIRAARERELVELNAAIEAAKKAKTPIPPSAAFSLSSLEDARQAAQSQAARLAAIDLTPMRRSLEKTARAREAMNREEWPAATSILQDALSSWPENSRAQSLLAQVEETKLRLEEASARAAEALAKAAEEAAKNASPDEPQSSASESSPASSN